MIETNANIAVKTRQAWLINPGEFEIRETTIKPGPGQVLVKVNTCGLCSWELNHWRGVLGECPQTLGHEISGTVAAFGDETASEHLAIGDHITCLAWGGFGDYIVADASNCVQLAKETPLGEALGEPLSCVITTLRGAAPEVGDIGIVIGCGPMGLWCIQALAGNMLGALIAVDVSEDKLKLAREFGATHVVNPRTDDTCKVIDQISKGSMADFVIEGTGNPRVLNDAIGYMRAGRGRLVMMSSHEIGDAAFDWRPAMSKGVQILLTHPAYSADKMADLRRSCKLLDRGVFSSKQIITHHYSLENIQEAFNALEMRPDGYIKGVVDLDSEIMDKN